MAFLTIYFGGLYFSHHSFQYKENHKSSIFISVSGCSLLIYGKTVGFCSLILYYANLQSSVVFLGFLFFGGGGCFFVFLFCIPIGFSTYKIMSSERKVLLSPFQLGYLFSCISVLARQNRNSEDALLHIRYITLCCNHFCLNSKLTFTKN